MHHVNAPYVPPWLHNGNNTGHLADIIQRDLCSVRARYLAIDIHLSFEKEM